MACSQRGDGPGLAVELLIGQMDLFVLAIDQIGERPVVGLVRRRDAAADRPGSRDRRTIRANDPDARLS